MKMFLQGQWQERGTVAEVIHPYDGAVLDTVPVGAPADISAALNGLEQGAAVMRALPTHRRVEILRRTAQLMAEQQEDLARLISREEGKVLAEGRIEAGRAMETLDLSADAARDLHGETVPLDATPGGVGKLGFTLRVPCGIVAAITPFNFPLNLVAHKIGPAIAGGHAVLLILRMSASPVAHACRHQGPRRVWERTIQPALHVARRAGILLARQSGPTSGER